MATLQVAALRCAAAPCCRLYLQDTIVVTDQRVLFLWRLWMFGMSLVSQEQSFYLDDLQVIANNE
jgi:hypothetical protein